MKINYFINRMLTSKKSGIIIAVAILAIILIVGTFSFALFTTSNEKRGALNITTGNLFSLIESKDLNQQKQITVGPGETKTIRIKLTNVNSMEAKINLYYGSSENLSNVVVRYSPDGNTPPTEHGKVLFAYDTEGFTEEYIIEIRNDGLSSVTLEFGSDAGLYNRPLVLPIGKYAITTMIMEI